MVELHQLQWLMILSITIGSFIGIALNIGMIGILIGGALTTEATIKTINKELGTNYSWSSFFIREETNDNNRNNCKKS